MALPSLKDKVLITYHIHLVTVQLSEIQRYKTHSLFSNCRNGLKKSTTGQGTDYEEDKKKEKIPVENSFDENYEKKHKEFSKLTRNQGPKLLQCSGGTGNSPTTNNVAAAAKQTENSSNHAVANTSHGDGNDDGECGGDGNDPPKKNLKKLCKGHYNESVEPLESKGIIFKEFIPYRKHKFDYKTMIKS
jgi:hypothetical protein